jgi:tRNA-2-methylthio-N6-dimethylallyladenosine synthase
MKYFIHTFGCQMNVRDSGEMGEALERAGYERARSAGEADLILVNTCTVRQKAVQKGLSAVGRYVHLKKSRKNLIVGAVGCYAQQEGGRLADELDGVDLVIGPDSKHLVAELAIERRNRKKPVVSAGLDGEQHAFDSTPRPRRAEGPAALVTIMKGCDNFCSFCVVPHVRGREVSRDPRDILSEIRDLAASGCREVTLLGQNVNSYAGGGASFPGLIDMICGIEGIERVRFTTSHPKDLSPELAERFRNPKLMPQIHLPVQAGSDCVLERMNRRYTMAGYLQKISLLRGVRPDIAITTDIIVGFPGETDADFRGTMTLVDEVRFDGAFSFKYSPRPGTAAERMEDNVPPGVKSERLAALQELVQKVAFGKSEALCGSVLPVLAEGNGRHAGQKSGRTPCNRVVNFSGGECRTGDIVMVEITEAMPHSLLGRFAGPAAGRAVT